MGESLIEVALTDDEWLRVTLSLRQNIVQLGKLGMAEPAATVSQIAEKVEQQLREALS